MKNYLFEKGQQVLIFPLTVDVNLRGVGIPKSLSSHLAPVN